MARIAVFPQVSDPGFTPSDCCSIFLLLDFDDGSQGANIIEAFSVPCDTPYHFLCCDNPSGSSQECVDLADEGFTNEDILLALYINCDPDIDTEGVSVETSLGPCIINSCKANPEGYGGTIIGWGITTACFGFYETIPAPPCPPGQQLHADGFCYPNPVDPPIPAGLHNLSGADFSLNPTRLHGGPPLPLASDGNGFARANGGVPLPVHPALSRASIEAACGACQSAALIENEEEEEF